MNTEKMFEVATRNKTRFPFKGLISAEDLWDLSVSNLDLIFKLLNSRLKQASEESLLDEKTDVDAELELQIEIIKHIVGIKLEESAAKAKAKEQKEKKQKIMEIIESKQDSELLGKSVEELKLMLDELS